MAIRGYLAGCVIALMLAAGEALEDYAGSRALASSRGLPTAPQHAHRLAEGRLETASSTRFARSGVGLS